jgi:hypothetical protein
MTDILKIDLGSLGLDRGAHLLVKRALGHVPIGSRLAVFGTHAELPVHLRAWCRSQGHEVEILGDDGGSGAVARITRGSAAAGRWKGAMPAGAPDRTVEGAVADRPAARWGLAARGATVEAGSPAFDFPLSDKDVVWADEAASLYAQAAAAQWDPAKAIDWSAPITHPPEIEEAVVQVMTFLIEN